MTPRHLDAVFCRAWTRRERRFASANEFLAALEVPAPAVAPVPAVAPAPPPLPLKLRQPSPPPIAKKAICSSDTRESLDTYARITYQAVTSAQREAATSLGVSVHHELDIGGVKLWLTLIPSGEFVMGSPPKEPGREKDELMHEVKITRAFLLGTTEVTQEQYRAVIGTNPSWFKGDNLLIVSSHGFPSRCQQHIGICDIA